MSGGLTVIPPMSAKNPWRIVPDCLRGGTFQGKNPSPVEANTGIRLLILYGVPVVNK
jgi:hypothetical protein